MSKFSKPAALVPIVIVLLLLATLTGLLLPANRSALIADRSESGPLEKFNRTPAKLHAAGVPISVNPADGLPNATPLAGNTDRKIIYSANIDLFAEDFAGVGDRVAALVKQFGGYIADSSVTGSTGENRRASWKIRVPIAQFDAFVAGAKGLGELVSASTNSQDVSEEYYDVDARIRNKTKEEERLLKLLEDRPGKLEDVIAIERELSRVREELERMQGRMRVLADRTSLTSVQLSVSEVREYQPAESPTLATRVRRAFESSLFGLQSAAELVVVGFVATTPWLVALVIAAIAGYVVVRLGLRRLGSRTA